MRQATLLILLTFLAACASERRATVASPSAAEPARYATTDEAARLHAQAVANFQREQERQDLVAGRSPSPRARGTAVGVTVQASTLPPVFEGPTERPAPRRRISPGEARYAMEIGKSPFDLTPGERAIAVGY